MESVYAFNNVWRYGIIHGFTLILFFLSFALINAQVEINARPYFMLMILYYWAIYRPSLMSAWFIFVIGFLYDLVLGFPAGLHSILFLAYYWIIKLQRVFFLGQGYSMTWIGFCLSCFAVLTLEHIFFSAIAGTFLTLSSVLNGLFLSGLIYPFVSLVLTLLSHILPPVSQTSFSVE